MPQKKNNSNNSEKPQNAYFLSLELENVRCFGERQKIDFSDENGKPKQWTIILGDNSAGKTTILRSLVAMIPVSDNKGRSSPNFATSDFSYKWDFVRKRAKQGKLQTSFYIKDYQDIAKNGNLNYECEIGGLSTTDEIALLALGIFPKSDFQSSFISEQLQLRCFAYGASRKAGETSLYKVNEGFPYKTLFDETVLLLNPEEWLLRIDYATRREFEPQEKKKNELELVKKVLIDILPDVTEIRIVDLNKFMGGGFRSVSPKVQCHTSDGWVWAKDLSLGYRTSMAWVVDFASRMFDLYFESENPLAEPAVVLIDEIDLHLHPKWQRELIDYLSNLFPNTQFIVTTHSPLIVQSAAARDANIVVCRREGDHVVIDQSVEAVRGWRADQILTSDLFDLPSTRDTELEKLEKQRREILSKAKLTKADEKKLKKLSTELNSLRVMENPEDDKAMDIIRRAAAHLQNGES